MPNGPAPMAASLLMVAYHYPPAGFSSGVHRTLCFANDLVDHGWQPRVLTVTPNAYATVFDDTRERIRPEVEVIRCPAIDSARTLAIGGRYLRLLALPDRWSSWILTAIAKGLASIRRQRPKAIWSTYPIASAHLIALVLHRLTGLPWIADFRDPMFDAHFPAHPWQRRCHAWIEAQAMRHAQHAVVTTEATRRAFAARYPRDDGYRAELKVIANGYDAQLFTGSTAYRFDGVQIGLLHSGLLDPADRPLEGLLAALAAYRESAEPQSPPLRLQLRASGHDAQLGPLIRGYGLEEAVDLLPPIPYQQAIDEMRASDLLVLIQGPSCPDQVPAKAYEYLRTGRPILGLCDPAGESARLLRNAGVNALAAPDDSDEIRALLAELVPALCRGEAAVISAQQADRYDRRHRSAELASLLEPFIPGP